MKKSDRKKLKNGWRYFDEQPPIDGRYVLVTNNPGALDAHGQMSHVWRLIPIKSGRGYLGFDELNRQIQGLVAWHLLPRNAT